MSVQKSYDTIYFPFQKMMKRFMKSKTGRDVGTLEQLKINIHRTSVNGNVKSRFAAHEEFVLLVGEAYFLEYAFTYFNMDHKDSVPSNHVEEGIQRSHLPKREKIFTTVFKDLASDVIGSTTLNQVNIIIS
jgi:hypothetical protein